MTATPPDRPAGAAGALLDVDAARAQLRAALAPITDSEQVPLADALGRVVSCDVRSAIDVPPHDNAAMDGYALRHAEWTESRALPVAGSALAGRPFTGVIAPGAVVRVMTGAVIPPGTDTVVPQEAVSLAADGIVLGAPVKPGAHVRPRGEDVTAGEVVLARGKVLGPAELGLAASLGMTHLPVGRRLRVAYFSTGDELRAPGATLAPGMIYDSNRAMLGALLARLNVEALDLGMVADDRDALATTLRHACSIADAVVTTGGVSVGEADFTRRVLAELGDVVFWQLAIKPGRPLAFGRLEVDGKAAFLFGLPGNPVAAMVTFYALVGDALRVMAGAEPRDLPRITARAAEPLAKTPGRTEYQRGIAWLAADGWRVRTTGLQGSGILRSMSQANCLIVLEHGQGPVAAGETVHALPLYGLMS